MDGTVLGTLGKCLQMLSPRQRRHWFLLVPVAIVASLAEAGSAASIFALIDVIGRDGQVDPSSWAGRIAAVLPFAEPGALLVQLALLVVGYQFLKGVLLAGAQYYRFRVASESAAELSATLLRRYLAAPYPFHFGRNSAELIRNCSQGVGHVLTGAMSASTSILSEILVGLGLAAVLFAAAPRSSLVAGLVLLAVVVALLTGMRPIVRRRGRAVHEEQVAVTKRLHQALGGVKEVKALGREPHFYQAFAQGQQRLLRLGYLGITLDAVPSLVVETVVVSGAIAALTMLALSGQAGASTLPLLGLFSYAALRFVPMANRLIVRVNEVRAGAVTAEALYEDYCALAEAEWEEDGLAAPAFREGLALVDVSYTYPGGEGPALRDVTLTIRPGESIGIVGPTGAGKSTLVDLILGLLEPSSGTIAVDGVDLRTCLAAWRRSTGYVPHSVFLIDDTLRRNVAFGLPPDQIDDQRVRAAMRAAQLERLVEQLPDGLETKIGDRGTRLSTGERQRVGIARALYEQPDVLVLDEATAALDGATESEVMRAISEERPARTLLVVSHRLSAVRRCDRLLLVFGGRIAASGTYDELAAHSLEFRAMAGG